MQATHVGPASVRDSANPVYQAYKLLHIGFTVAPIIAGLDKFFGILADWTMYLWPGVSDITRIPPATFMWVVGAVEILAGVLVAIRPRIGGYVVAAWLVGIIINLLLLGASFDIALRDVGSR